MKVRMKKRTKAATLHEFKGKQMTVAEIAATLGLTKNAIYQRLRGNQSAEVTLRPGPKPEANSKPRATGTVKTYTFAGKTMTLAAWSKETGISAGTLRDRMELHRWPLERVFTEPVMLGAERALRRRNAIVIARMLDTMCRTMTGGQSQTSDHSLRTGVCPSNFHCEGVSA